MFLITITISLLYFQTFISVRHFLVTQNLCSPTAKAAKQGASSSIFIVMSIFIVG